MVAPKTRKSSVFFYKVWIWNYETKSVIHKFKVDINNMDSNKNSKNGSTEQQRVNNNSVNISNTNNNPTNKTLATITSTAATATTTTTSTTTTTTTSRFGGFGLNKASTNNVDLSITGESLVSDDNQILDVVFDERKTVIVLCNAGIVTYDISSEISIVKTSATLAATSFTKTDGSKIKCTCLTPLQDSVVAVGKKKKKKKL